MEQPEKWARQLPQMGERLALRAGTALGCTERSLGSLTLEEWSVVQARASFRYVQGGEFHACVLRQGFVRLGGINGYQCGKLSAHTEGPKESRFWCKEPTCRASGSIPSTISQGRARNHAREFEGGNRSPPDLGTSPTARQPPSLVTRITS